MKKINSYLGYSPNRISRVGKLSTANHSLESVVFQQGKSILDYDLNVMQDVINNSISSVASSIYKTSGFLSNVTPLLSTAFSLTLPFSDVNLMGKVFSVKSGITGNSAITASSGLGSSVNVLWWLEIWFQEIVPSGNTANAEIIGSGLTATKDTQIYLHGGETNSGIYATPTTGGPINDLLDPVFAAETTRRVQLRWRIRSSNITSSTAGFGTITNGTYSPEVGVVAQGGRSSDFAYSSNNVVSTTNPFKFIRSDQSSATISIHPFSEVSATPSFYLSDMLYSLRDIATLMDSPLYIAGRGTDDDAQQLNTVDGRVYGLQIGISTKNTNTYSFVKTMSVPAVSSSSQIVLGNTSQVAGSGYGLSLTATDATISAVSESNTVANLTISTQDASSSSLSYVLAKRISLTTVGTQEKPSFTFDNVSSTRTTGLYFSSSGSAQALNISALENRVASFAYYPALVSAITGTIQLNKNTVVVSSTTGMSAGMLLTRSGIAGAGVLSSLSATTITAVLNTTTFSISPAATTAGPVDFTLGPTPAISLFGPLSTSSSIFLSAANSVPSVTITTSGITTTSTTDPSSIANLTSAAFSSAAVNITGGSISGANLNLVNSAAPGTAGRLTYGSDFTLWLGAGGSPVTYKQFGYLATENISTVYTAGSGATVTWSGGSSGAIPSGVSVPSSGGGSGYKIGDQVRVSGVNNNALLSVATLTANSTAVATWTLVSGGTGYAASGGTGVATSATGKTTSISGFSATIANTGTAIDVARSDHVHATPATWSPSAHAASHALAASGTGGTDALTGNIDAVARTSIKTSASSGLASGGPAQRRVIDVRAGANIRVALTEPTSNTDDSMVLQISADIAGYQDTKATVTSANTTGSGDFVPLPSTVSGSYGLVPISYLVPGVQYIIKTAGDTSLANWKSITGISSLTSGDLLSTSFTAQPVVTPTSQYVGTGSCLPVNQFAARREHSHPASPERSFASASTIASLKTDGSGSAGADNDLTVAKGSHVHAFPVTLTARFAFGEAYSGSISDTLDISGTTSYSTRASSLFVRQRSYATPTPSAPASVVNTGGRIAFGGQTSTADATAVGVFGAISARKSSATNNNSSGYLSLWSSTNDTLVESLRAYSTGSIHIGSSSTYGLSGYEIDSGSLQVDSQIRIGAPRPTVMPVVSAITTTGGRIASMTIASVAGYPAGRAAFFIVLQQGSSKSTIIYLAADTSGNTSTTPSYYYHGSDYSAYSAGTPGSKPVTLSLLYIPAYVDNTSGQQWLYPASYVSGNAVFSNDILANGIQIVGNAIVKSLTVTDLIAGNISGTAPAGSLTGDTLASNVTTSSLTSVGTLGSLTVTNAINGTLTSATTGNTDLTVLSATMATNDSFRIRVGGASDVGYVEIATADNGTEPIYVRQYTLLDGAQFGTMTRTAALLDGAGNTSFPETLSVKALKIGTAFPTAVPTLSTIVLTASTSIASITIGTGATTDYLASSVAYFSVVQGTNSSAIVTFPTGGNGAIAGSATATVFQAGTGYTATAAAAGTGAGAATLSLLYVKPNAPSNVSTATGNIVVSNNILADSVTVLGSATLKSLTVTDTITGNISGTAPAGSLTGNTLASNVTASSLTSVGTLGSLTVTNAINGTLASAATNNAELTVLSATMATNDYFRIRVGGASDVGYAEIATADNGTEPIYVRQYSNATIDNVATPFGSLTRSASLLDGAGNTSFPETLSVKALKIGTAFPTAVPVVSTIVLTTSASSIASITLGAGAGEYLPSSVAYFRVVQVTNSSAIVTVAIGINGTIGNNATATVFQAGTGYTATATAGAATLSLLYVKPNAPSNVSTATGNIVVSNNILADSVTVLGNVGIGTTSPGSTLHVVAPNASDIEARFTGGNTQGIAIQNGTLWEYRVAADTGEIAFNYTGYNTGTTYFRNTQIYNGKYGTLAFFQGSTGRLGIGTTTPAEKLHVTGNVLLDNNNGYYIKNSEGTACRVGAIDTTNQLIFGDGVTTSMYFTAGANIYFNANGAYRGNINGTTGYWRIGDSTAATVALDVVGTGKFSTSLSIGTIGYTLDDYTENNQIRLFTTTTGKSLWINAPGGITLNNNTYVTGNLQVAGTTTDVYAHINNTAAGGRSWFFNATSDASGEGGGRLLFKDGSAAATRMTIDSSGNVGIGTTSPAATLHVVGTVAGAVAPKVFLPAQAFNLPPSNAPSFYQRDTGTTKYELQYSGSADQNAHTTIVVPSSYSGGSITIKFYWYTALASQSVTWQILAASTGDGGDPNPSTSSLGDIASTTNLAAKLKLQTFSWISSNTVGLPSAGQILYLSLKRVGSTNTETFNFHSMTVEF